MNKVIRDRKVAVLYSPGYGAGWYTWHNIKELLFDPVVVQFVENNEHAKIEDYCKTTHNEYEYYGGACDLEIEWVPEGTIFEISEYDGNESVRIINNNDFLTA